jgi:hypothetical protein
MAAIPPVDKNSGDVLSWVAFAINVSLHFTQVPLMYVMLKDNDPISRSLYSVLPTVFQAAACSQWIGYAIFVLPSLPLVINNSIGLSVSFLYVLCFLITRPSLFEKVTAFILWLTTSGFALLVYGILYSADYPNRDIYALSITTIVTIFLWAAPLVALRAAAIELDTKRVPLPLTFVMFSTTLMWLIVGILLGDMALIVCSAFGVTLSSLQLGVIIWIRIQSSLRIYPNNELVKDKAIISIVNEKDSSTSTSKKDSTSITDDVAATSSAPFST